jgi:hypothetical protein
VPICVANSQFFRHRASVRTRDKQPRSGPHPEATSARVSGTPRRKLPFGFNPRAAARQARFRKAQSGMTKAEIEAANQEAIERHAEQQRRKP